MKKQTAITIIILLSITICALIFVSTVKADGVVPSVNAVLSSSSVIVGNPVTVTATVSGDAGIPTGTVTFAVTTNGDQSQVLFDSEPLNGAGVATSVGYIPTLVSGSGVSYEFKVAYSGDTNYQSNYLLGCPLTVVNADPSVSISPSGPLTIDASMSVSFTATGSGGSGTYSTFTWFVDGT
ncbi:MAG TPA: hypothetical protein VLV84_04635, partial [Candidatus Acidoferrales bacterium]|nr:hypothetical protein [Candidatus Acidoferrales bacterium]